VTKDLYFKGDNVTIEAVTNLTLHVGDSFIAINSDGIKISSTAKIAIVATADLEQSGANVKVTADTDITQTATSGKVSVSSVGNIALSASTGDVTASAMNVTLTGNMGATVKGTATAELSASGQVTVKGAVVMIN